ncbi:hypothetical protein MLD38_013861 [Melastoma candidum]|uniref:Uncharacterized protein n=1 Tax=Melastoma candidum TaxID=119954 RepID=A0ACB9RAC0_9MYRT|nr:hypothetical protein MLD38_013861 [Melastoma candidum]
MLPGNPQQQIDMLSVGNFDSAAHQQAVLSGIGGASLGEHNFTEWRDGRNEVVPMQQDGVQNLQGQGLSLSLAPHIPSGVLLPLSHFRNLNTGLPSSSESGSRNGEEQLRAPEFGPSGIFRANSQQDSDRVNLSVDGMASMSRTIMHSRYLRAAQQLLDEVVNVRKALKPPDNKEESRKGETQSKGSKEGDDEESKDEEPQDSRKSSKSELSHGERQELQNKLTKLMSMLDEVDRRYKQYYYQMQIVVSSFDSIAGTGAAKPYTALALQTISRHFRCLRDAITGQIQATRKSLGEDDTSGNGKGVGITRLRYIDQQIRQRRALQQLGMMQPHAWRPQRGLPESSVTILRAWLFEHFLHPYPKDSDKIMLARQTGLTRSQVSNWFINARVRLWKPMVEEMYKEELGDADIDSNSSSEIAGKGGREGNEYKAYEDRVDDFQQTSSTTGRVGSGHFMDASYNQFHAANIAGTSGGTDYFGRNLGVVDSCNLYQEAMAQSNTGNDRFMTAYQMSELARFGDSGGVSLTLGLQHFEGGALQIPSAGAGNGFVTMRGGETMYDVATSSLAVQGTEFEAGGLGNQPERYGSGHMLHDFVA